MNWQDALDMLQILHDATGHRYSLVPRYRWLCSDDNPNVEQRAGYRRLMIEKATGEPSTPPTRPNRQPPVRGGCCG